MIIKIEDAPHIKNIKIDINFDDDGPVVHIDNGIVSATKSSQKKPTMDDIKLDMDEDFEVNTEIVAKPEIPDTNRDANVSNDMKDAEF